MADRADRPKGLREVVLVGSALGGAGLAALLLWTGRSPAEPARPAETYGAAVDGPPPVGEAPAHDTTRRGRPPVAEVVATAEPAPAPAEGPPPDPETPHSGFPTVTGDRPKVPSQVFEAKYEGADLGELLLAREHLERSQEEASARIRDEVFAMGLYEEYVYDEDERASLPECPYEKGYTKLLQEEELPSGRRRQWRSFVPYELYPEYYEENDELFWLIRRLREARAEARGR